MTDYRAELQRLVKAYDEHGGRWPDHHEQALFQAVEAARTTLAQPEPEGLPPRVGHILRLAEIIREVDGSHDKGAAALAEAILSHPGSRWSPTTEPVPVAERLPGAEDCDAEGRCWMFDPCDRGWWSYSPALPSDGDPAPFTHWLPHHALPVPGAEDGQP
jgi:hypothetical protein